MISSAEGIKNRMLFRSRLQAGELLFGTLVTFASPEPAEVLAQAGYDWLFIDLEHSSLGIREVQAILQAVAGQVECLVRVPLNDEIWIKKALDTGAAGVIIPQVNTPAQAEQAVRWAKYSPRGSRSVGLARAQQYGADLAGYIERANAETTCVIQVETAQAVKNIAGLLAVDGIDAVLVGPYDLSASLGQIGQVEHPDVKKAIDRVRQACQRRAMPLGIFAAGAARAAAYVAEGYRLIAVGTDALLLRQAARESLSILHSSR